MTSLWGPVLAKYLREPVWAFRVTNLKTAAVLLGYTARHHAANWLKRTRDDGSTFTVNLDLGGAGKSSVTLRAIGGDISILYEVFAEQTYRVPDAALPPDSVRTVVDCGAHVGLTALYFAHRYPRARVIAIEPNPANFQLLLANTAQEPRIVPLEACVSDRTGVARISIDDRPGWNHQIGLVGAEVAALTLDEVRRRFDVDTIDLLKMDVEGSESAIFSGGISNVRAIAAELHLDYTVELFARDVAPLTIWRPEAHGRFDPVFALSVV